MKNTWLANALLALALLAPLVGCKPKPPGHWQGYLEGEFVYVAAPLAGRLESLAVIKGQRVAAGAPLFALEQTTELATQREAADRVRQAEARLADLQKGQRPTELAALEARIEQARAGAELAQRTFDRSKKLHDTGALSDEDFDRARLTNENNQRLVAQAQAELATAQLGARRDTIAAAEADVSAARAALDRANWSVAQKSQTAPKAALVFDTLYRPGEFVAAGLPVISLLPPENIRVRFFVPEAKFGELKAGATVHFSITGGKAVEARISYLSPQPEYTPPVLYNRENRSKLVFMVEATPVDPAAAHDLHPGQPVDVTP